MRTMLILLSAVLLSMSSACERPSRTEVERAATLTGGGDARLGRTEIRKYGCNTCHEISGVARSARFDRPEPGRHWRNAITLLANFRILPTISCCGFSIPDK